MSTAIAADDGEPRPAVTVQTGTTTTSTGGTPRIGFLITDRLQEEADRLREQARQAAPVYGRVYLGPHGSDPFDLTDFTEVGDVRPEPADDAGPLRVDSERLDRPAAIEGGPR